MEPPYSLLLYWFVNEWLLKRRLVELSICICQYCVVVGGGAAGLTPRGAERALNYLRGRRISCLPLAVCWGGENV